MKQINRKKVRNAAFVPECSC